MTDHSSRVLVVGASAAGLATATALRRRGFSGEIRLLGAETHQPYDRPPLSKQHLSGTWADDRLGLLAPDVLTGLELDLRLGTTAVALDLDRRSVQDARGDVHEFDHLVIATGLQPRRLRLLEHLATHVLRTIDDGARLRVAIGPGVRVLVIGAGFLGLETAATARLLGAQVDVIDPVLAPLADRIGSPSSQRLLGVHRQHGVHVRCGATVVSAQVTPTGVEVSTSDGGTILADVVLESVGSVPCTEWLEGSGLELADGVVCDERSAAAPGVWAAGDVARWHHVGYDRSLRIEHRTNATEHGQHVAAAITGERAPYTPLPFFWTDHFDARIQVAGQITPGAKETVSSVEGRPGSAVHLFHEGDRLTGVLGWNASREIGPFRRELASAVKRPLLRA